MDGMICPLHNGELTHYHTGISIPSEHIAANETNSANTDKEVLPDKAVPPGRGAMIGSGVAENMVKAEEGVAIVAPGSGVTGSVAT